MVMLDEFVSKDCLLQPLNRSTAQGWMQGI
jgi:hypothetical protein